MTKIVNLFGGPGTGKSTTAAGVFHRLKLAGVNAEYVPEFAKDLCWEGNPRISHQLSVFAEQAWRVQRLVGKVDWIVTDSPILLSIIYAGEHGTAFRKLVWETHESLPSFNVFLRRVKPYQQAGRFQDEDGARKLDTSIRQMLDSGLKGYATVDADQHAAAYIAGMIV